MEWRLAFHLNPNKSKTTQETNPEYIDKLNRKHFNMDVSKIAPGESILSRPAEEFGNDASVEAMWAQRAFEYAEIHFNIICSADPKFLRLTQYDDEIYQLFRRDFPSMKVDIVDEGEMKSKSGKEKWRAFFEKLSNKVEDPSFGTLLRVDVSGEYSEQNTILTPRVQFYAVEIARNREGCNDKIKEKYLPRPLET